MSSQGNFPIIGQFRETPLIDRINELQFLKEAANRATIDQGGLVFLRGEAGIGKTRIIKEIQAYARSHGMKILYGKSAGLFSEIGQQSYFIWKTVIRDYLRSCTPEQLQKAVGYYPGEIYKIVPEVKNKLILFSESQPLSPELERDRLFESISQFITNISKSAPLLLVFDDLQWADASSLLVLQYLARGIQSENILIIGAYRSSEIQEPQLLLSISQELKREHVLQFVDLKRFEEEDTSKMIKSIIGTDNTPADFCRRIYEKTNGNPFFVEELIESLKEQGIILPDGEAFRVDQSIPFELPKTVKDLLKIKLNRLSNEERQILTLASFVGNDFDFEALKKISGIEVNQLLQTVEDIQNKGFLSSRVVEGKGICSFIDVLIRDILYEEVHPLRRTLLHKEIGDALEKAYLEEIAEHYGELAAHFLNGDNKTKALDYLVKAGEKATKVHANNEAASYYTSALKLLEPSEKKVQERCRILEALGDIKGRIGEYPAALECWKKATELWNQIPETQKVARLYRKSGNLLIHSMGKPQEAKEFHLKALQILEKEPDNPELAILNTDLAHLYWHTGDTAQAIPLAQKAFTISTKLNDNEAAANALLFLGKLAGHAGDKQKCIENFEKALKIALENGFTETSLWAYNGFAQFALFTGQRRLELCEKTYNLAKKVGAISIQSWEGSLLARLNFFIGNIDYAKMLAEESVAIDRRSNNLHNLVGSLAALSQIYRILGDIDTAEKLSVESLEISRAQNIIPALASANANIGFLYLLKEDYSGARNYLEKAVDISKKALGFKRIDDFSIPSLIMANIKLGKFDEAENLIKFLNNQPKTPLMMFVVGMLNGTLLLARKQFDESIDCFERTIALPETQQIKQWFAPFYLQYLKEYSQGYLERNQTGDKATAETILKEMLEISQKLNSRIYIERTNNMLARLKTGQTASWSTKQENRLKTGYSALDKVLYGGLPLGYAVVLTSPPCDEKATLIKKFLEEGAKNNQNTLYFSMDAGSIKPLSQEYPANFSIITTNKISEDSTNNIYPVAGIENLTNISIAVTSAIRKIKPSENGRACINIVSDVLLQHGPLLTRKWLFEIVGQLKKAKLTLLVTVDPQLHPSDQLHAVISLLDGEITIREAETERGFKRFLRVRRLSNQKYIKDEIVLEES